MRIVLDWVDAGSGFYWEALALGLHVTNWDVYRPGERNAINGHEKTLLSHERAAGQDGLLRAELLQCTVTA